MDRRKQTTYKRRSAEYGGQGVARAAAPVQNVQVKRTALVQRKRKFTWTKRSVLVATGLLVLLVGGGATYAQLGPSLNQSSATGVNLQKDLVGWWKLDGNLVDSTPNRNNGIATGASPTVDRKNKTNGAFIFNTGNGVDLPTSAALNSNVFSYSAWVYQTTSNSNRTIIGSTANNGPQLRLGNGTPVLTRVAASPITIATATASVPLNTWTHVAVSYDASGNYRFYINGQLSGSGTNAYTFTFSNYKIGYRSASSEYFIGSIDDVRIYKRAINADEAKALTDGYNPTTTLGSGEKGLVGWWKMDGNSNDSTPWRRTSSRNNAILTSDRKGTANSAYVIGSAALNGIDINSNSATDPLTSFNALSISAWVRFDGAPSTCRTIIYKRSTFSTNVPGFAMYWCAANNNIAIDMGRSDSNRWNTGYVPTLGTWTHYVFTFNGGTGRFYVNGQLYGTSTVGSLANAQLQSNMTIGKTTTNTGGYNLGGAVDDVRVYTREMSANEIGAQYKSYNSQISINSNSNNVNTSTGLVGYWPFNGNANDATPYRTNGVVTGATLTSDRNNATNKSYSFDGNGYITIPSSQQLNTGSLTYSAWVKPTTASGLQTIIGSTAAGGPQFRLDNSGLRFLKQTIISVCSSTSGIVGNTWTHVAVTYNSNGTCRLYVNGVLSNSASSQQTFNFSNLQFGRRSGTATETFTGSMDDIRIYNRDLSASEIAKLYTDYR